MREKYVLSESVTEKMTEMREKVDIRLDVISTKTDTQIDII